MLIYKITVTAEHKRIMKSKLNDKSEHYVAAYSVDQAIQHVEIMMKKAGWEITDISVTNVVLEDIRDSCDRTTEEL